MGETTANGMLTSSLFIVRKLSQAFFNAQQGDKVGGSFLLFVFVFFAWFAWIFAFFWEQEAAYAIKRSQLMGFRESEWVSGAGNNGSLWAREKRRLRYLNWLKDRENERERSKLIKTLKLEKNTGKSVKSSFAPGNRASRARKQLGPLSAGKDKACPYKMTKLLVKWTQNLKLTLFSYSSMLKLKKNTIDDPKPVFDSGNCSVLDSPLPCTRKISAEGSYLFKTVTKLWRRYIVVLPRLYGCRGSD